MKVDFRKRVSINGNFSHKCNFLSWKLHVSKSRLECVSSCEVARFAVAATGARVKAEDSVDSCSS
jgi:hypothetical protein